ncbi:unnamed protein product, partial [Iphiclides podalirius]
MDIDLGLCNNEDCVPCSTETWSGLGVGGGLRRRLACGAAKPQSMRAAPAEVPGILEEEKFGRLDCFPLLEFWTPNPGLGLAGANADRRPPRRT